MLVDEVCFMVKPKKSMSTIAESLGVSRCTVSLVLNGREREARISSDTAERIRKFCRDIGYQPNIHSRRMQSSIVRNIMVCVDPLIGAPDKDNLFSDGNFSGILGGIVTAATNEDVKTTICTWHFSQPDTQELVFNSFRSREIDGLIFYGMDMPDSWSQAVIDENFHIVGIHSNPVAGIHTVDANNYHASRQMVIEFLLKRNCRKFLYVGGTALSLVSRERFRGFTDALASYGIAFLEKNYIKADFMENIASAKLQEFIDSRQPLPDAIVCANDRMAIGVMNTLVKNGIRVPEDVAVCGSEGIELTRYVHPTIATFDQHSKEIGRKAFELLWNKINGRDVQNIVVDYELVPGESIPQI